MLNGHLGGPRPDPRPVPPTVKRGIRPEPLLDLILNTAPFLFENRYWGDQSPHLDLILSLEKIRRERGEVPALSHAQYFEFCTAAHHATVCTFVPTDVDNQIRFKLWAPELPTEIIEEMTEVVIASYDWDYAPVSTRYTPPIAGLGRISGHQGEWFSTAAAAYGALRKRLPKKAEEILVRIAEEISRETAYLVELKKRQDGVGFLKAATLIAHNLGDLDRVIEQWNLPEDDPLRKNYFKLGHEGGAYSILVKMGTLNTAVMAGENHRHFPMRIPRGLRRSQDLLLPISPFLDDWGKIVATSPVLTPEDLGIVLEALVDGYERVVCIGYARALAGIEQAVPGGLGYMETLVPSKIARKLKSGTLRTQSSLPQERFEMQWGQKALKAMS